MKADVHVLILASEADADAVRLDREHACAPGCSHEHCGSDAIVEAACDAIARAELVDVAVPECVERWRSLIDSDRAWAIEQVGDGLAECYIAADCLEWLATASLAALAAEDHGVCGRCKRPLVLRPVCENATPFTDDDCPALLATENALSPRPWHVEHDWTFEVHAADGTIVGKFRTREEAQSLCDGDEHAPATGHAIPFADVLPLLRAGLRWRRWARGIESRGRVVRALLEEVDTFLIKLPPEQRREVEASDG